MSSLQHKKKVSTVLDYFLSLFFNMKGKKPIINIFSLMLDLVFKIFIHYSHLLVVNKVRSLLSNMTKGPYTLCSSMSSSLKPFGWIWMWHCCQGVDEDYNLNIFEMIMNTNESTKELVIIKLLIFKQYEADVKDIKQLLQWWEKHET